MCVKVNYDYSWVSLIFALPSSTHLGHQSEVREIVETTLLELACARVPRDRTNCLTPQRHQLFQQVRFADQWSLYVNPIVSLVTYYPCPGILVALMGFT